MTGDEIEILAWNLSWGRAITRNRTAFYEISREVRWENYGNWWQENKIKFNEDEDVRKIFGLNTVPDVLWAQGQFNEDGGSVEFLFSSIHCHGWVSQKAR